MALDTKPRKRIIRDEVMEQFRCPKCNALLFEHDSYIGKIVVKCHRCGVFTKRTFDNLI
jgi:uncharacterized C2H2 Zn-finger protein